MKKLNESIIFQNDRHARSIKREEKINTLTKMTDNQLYKLSGIFPFDLFPNKVFIEQKQIIIRYRQFFFTHQDYHILIEDILMPIVEASLFFATLKIEMGVGGFQQNPPPVEFLKKSEAKKAKRIITGLLVCQKEKIDLSNMSRENILEKVEEIGRFKHD